MFGIKKTGHFSKITLRAKQFRAICKFFLAEKQKSSCQNRTFSKITLLLRLAAFIDALLA